MSKDWEVVQEKAFTAWVNGVLTNIGEKVNDITTDFSDGVMLIHFLELLSGKKIGKKIELEPKSRILKIQNLHLAMQFTETLEVTAQGVGAEDFVDSNKKLILGFLWTLYRKYRIATIKEGDKSSEEGLLLWCKNTTDGYAGVDIQSFKRGFRDGNAFLALAHKYDPSFNYDDFQNESPEQRLEKAFDLAEQNMNIPKLLDVSEVLKGTADERSLILYTSLFFHAFAAKEQKEALDASQREAANKLGSLESSLHAAQLSKDELIKKNQDLEKEKLAAQAALEAKQKEFEKDLEAKQRELEAKQKEIEAEAKRTQDMAEQNKKLLQEIEELKKRIAELESRVSSAGSSHADSESRLAAANAKLEQQSKRADTEFSGLLTLRQQFDQHVLDMHRWRKLCEVDVADFHTETKVPLLEELAKEGGFEKQLALLQSKLGDETKDILKYLNERQEFAKQKMKKPEK